MKFARKLIHGGPVHLCHRPLLLFMYRGGGFAFRALKLIPVGALKSVGVLKQKIKNPDNIKRPFFALA